MQFARRLWLAAACTLGVLLGVSSAHAQQLKLLPSDTEMIMTFNIQQILKSEVFKSNKTLVDLAKGKIEEGLEDQGVAKWLKKAEFDLFRDLTSVTFAIPGGRKPDEGFVLFEGKFNAAKIESAVTEAAKEDGNSKVKIVTIANIRAFEVTPKEDKTMYIGILNKKTMIACGSKKDFAEAVKRLSDDEGPAFKAAVLKKLMSTVNNKQSISIVATAKLLTKLGENVPQAGGAQGQQALAALKTMEGFSAAITLAKNIDFQLGVNTMDAETAQKYSGIANLAIGVAKMKMAEQAKQNEKLAPLGDVVNTIRVTSQGSNLLIRGQVTAENLAKLLELLPIPN